MENISDYTNVFMQMPMAVILLIYMYKNSQTHNDFVKEVLKIIKREKE